MGLDTTSRLMDIPNFTCRVLYAHTHIYVNNTYHRSLWRSQVDSQLRAEIQDNQQVQLMWVWPSIFMWVWPCIFMWCGHAYSCGCGHTYSCGCGHACSWVHAYSCGCGHNIVPCIFMTMFPQTLAQIGVNPGDVVLQLNSIVLRDEDLDVFR